MILLDILDIGAVYAVLFDKLPDMCFGSVRENSDASRLVRLNCFHCVNCYGGQSIPAAMIEKIGKGASEGMLLVYIYSCFYHFVR